MPCVVAVLIIELLIISISSALENTGFCCESTNVCVCVCVRACVHAFVCVCVCVCASV